MTVDRSDAGCPVVVVSGDLDFTTIAPLRTELQNLLDQRPGTIVLDFGGLSFIDSTGLSIIVHTWRSGHDSGTALHLRNTPKFLATILDITGVAGLLARPPEGDSDGSAVPA
ncbi:STAS domain-containing protein [Micromonospora echinofusca]|nr:STAS domain-containing protein [Micromonospora echinofusca]